MKNKQNKPNKIIYNYNILIKDIQIQIQIQILNKNIKYVKLHK